MQERSLPHPTHRLRAWLAAGAALALTACAAVGPNYKAPAPTAPSSWQAPLPASQAHGGSVGRLNQWWQQFDDPVLARLVTLAQDSSPSLASSWASIEKARATLKSAGGSGWPAVNASASASRSNQQQAATGTATGNSRSAGLDSSWELDLFGKIRRNTEAAEARVQARTADWHDARVSLAAEVADTYVQYRACQLLVDAYEREQVSNAETEKATAAAVKAGFNAPSDGALARASLASARSTLVQQQAQCELLAKSLVYLTGSDEPALRTLMGTGNSQVPQPAALEVQAVPADVLRQRPDLASLERELAAASAEIGVAQAELYPSLSLSGSVTVSATSLVSPATSWSFGPSLSLPLFDGGQRRAAVDSAQASYDAARASYQQGVRTVVKEVEQALVNLDSTARRAEQADSAAREYRDYFRAIEANWRAGSDSLLTLEEARRSALSAEINRITLQRDRVQYWIALYKALGGGWQPNTPVNENKAG
jgi:multidrug efflux system outer membrane protein